MKKSLIILSILFTFSGYGQDISSLLDSVNKYIVFDSKKALDFGFQALKLNNTGEVSSDIRDINSSIGSLLFFSKNYTKSIEYFANAIRIHQLIPKSERKHPNVNKPPWVLVGLGNLYYNTNNYEKSIKSYNEAIENFNLYEKSDSLESSDGRFGLNTSESNLALVYTKLENFKQAEFYHKKSLKRREKIGKKSSIMFQYMVMIDFYFQFEKEELGLYYFDLAQKLFLNENQNKIIDSEIKIWYAYALTVYGSHLINKKEFKKALTALNQGKELSIGLVLNLDHMPNIDLELANCLIQLKRYDESEKVLLDGINFSSSDELKIKKYNVLAKLYKIQNKKTALIKIKDSIIKTFQEKEIINFDNIEGQLILNEKEIELYDNRLKDYKFITLISIVILISFLLIITLISRYKIQKEKNARLELEKNEFSSKLESKNRELASKANFILQRNEYLKNIKAKLKKSEVNENSFRRIEKEVTELISSEKSYVEFDKIFTNVYPEFYKVLNERHSLSQTYLRLAAYIKMNQTNNEIAKMSGISLRTVETQRYRLSKILNIDASQDLNTYILSV